MIIMADQITDIETNADCHCRRLLKRYLSEMGLSVHNLEPGSDTPEMREVYRRMEIAYDKTSTDAAIRGERAILM
jgi:hypothetical protein